jgi:hypothetical protein
LLGEASVKPDAEVSEIRLELLRVLKYDSGHAKTIGGFGILGNVVNVDGFRGGDFAGSEGFSIDEGVRFACANPKGVDASRKKTKEGEAFFSMRHVDRVGIGEESESKVSGESFEELVGLYGFGHQRPIPNLGELLECEGAAETLGEMRPSCQSGQSGSFSMADQVS